MSRLDRQPRGEAAATEQARPLVSVIVVSLDRRGPLERALASIEAQTLGGAGYEIIVVDDGSQDGTWEMLDTGWRGAPEAGRPRRVALRHERPRGPGGARNAASQHARGQVLAFMDSDCAAEPGWLEALVRPLLADSEGRLGAVGGSEVDDPHEPRVARAVNFAMTSVLTTGRIRGGDGARAARYRPRTFNMAVRKDAFDRAGGFSDLLQGEDIDLALRIEQQGLKLVFSPEARVRHRRRRTLGSVWSQAFSMGRARTTLIRRDRGHLEAIYFAPPLLVAGGLSMGLAALVWPVSRPIVLTLLVVALLHLGCVACAAAWTFRTPAPALLAPVVFLIQQVAYGLGFLFGVLAPAREGYAR